MDEYDSLLKKINEEAFFKGKKWTEEQIKQMSALKKQQPLRIPTMMSSIEMQQKVMREKMGLSDTEGLALTEENMNKLISELSKAKNVFFGCVISNDILYKDFSHFSSYLINKYFTKE